MRVLSFSLLDASNGETIPGYEDVTPGAGMLLTRRNLPRQVNIRANTEGEVGSVRWMWNGQLLRVTNTAPHLAWEEGWIPPIGEGALTVTPHAGADATGRSGGGRKLDVAVREKIPAVKVVTAAVTPASEDNIITLNPDDAEVLIVTGQGRVKYQLLEPPKGMNGRVELCFEQPPEGGFIPDISNANWPYNEPPHWSSRPGQHDLVGGRKIAGVVGWKMINDVFLKGHQWPPFSGL